MLSIVIAEVGSENIHNISIEYDSNKALTKIIIEGNVDYFIKKVDQLFGTDKLKPSNYILIDKWIYKADGNIASLEMGGSRFPPPEKVWRIGGRIAKTIRRQCYFYAKGYKYISKRGEKSAKRKDEEPKPIQGYLKLGFDSSIVNLLYRILLSSSPIREFDIMGRKYTLIILVSEPPKTVDEAFTICRSFYNVRYNQRISIEINQNILRRILPGMALNLLLEAPDLVYHNLTLNLVRSHIQRELEIANFPSVSIYIFPEGVFDENKEVLVYLTCTGNYLRQLHSLLTRIHGIERCSYVINHIDEAIQCLGGIVRRAQKDKKFTVIEAVIPHLRVLMNNLVSGAPYMEPLYATLRILKELERIDIEFRRLAEELIALI
jgi:hypothetical protein